MKNAVTVACTVFFVSIACFALPTNPAPLSSAALAVILAEPASDSPCATRPSPSPSPMLFASSGIESICDATAFCANGSTVYCAGNSTCTTVDANCSVLEAGRVTCDGVTTACPGCCSTGTIRQRDCCRCAATGGCLDCCRCGGGGGGTGSCALQCSY